MEQIGTIGTACRYPVKSMAGEEIEDIFVGFSGVMGDRAYAFVPNGETKAGFPWHTGRDHETLVLYRPHYCHPDASRQPVDVTASFALGPGVNPVYPSSEAFAVEVTTPGGRTLAVDGAELATELETQGGKALTLRFSERSFYDCRPVSLLGRASVRALGEEMGMAMDPRRFRANFYADWNDEQPYREDGLIGRTLQIGERLRIMILERDPRCKMITLHPDTGELDPSILRHVARAHDGKAGVYAAVLAEGVARKGDPIWLV